MHTNNIIGASQYAYMPDRSTTDQLIDLTYQFAKVNDNNGRFDCVFLDFRKAFDKVYHPHLLSELQKFMTSQTLQWFMNYLNERTVEVRIDNFLSQRKKINAGVPQGSHLAHYCS